MADTYITDLPTATQLTDTDALLVNQSGIARMLTGALLRSFVDRNVINISIVTVDATEPAGVREYDPENGTLVLNIPRGAGIDSISNPTVSDLNKTYTITWEIPYGESTPITKQFTVKDGDPIVSVTEVDVTHASGHLDVYQINFQERTAIQFSVRNGTDGNGAPGYDPPKMDSGTTGVVGTAVAYARQDHVHPSDTSRQAAKLSFSNENDPNWGAVAWNDDPEELFEDFPKRGTISCTGVTASMYPMVSFDAADATSGILAPNAKCGSGVVYIYAAETPASAVKVNSVVVLP